MNAIILLTNTPGMLQFIDPSDNIWARNINSDSFWSQFYWSLVFFFTEKMTWDINRGTLLDEIID